MELRNKLFPILHYWVSMVNIGTAACFIKQELQAFITIYHINMICWEPLSKCQPFKDMIKYIGEHHQTK